MTGSLALPTAGLPLWAVATVTFVLALPAYGQAVHLGTVDQTDIVSSARAAQASFERRRIRYLPVNLTSFGGDCDEVIGRICTTYSEGEWYPVPEDDEIVRMRARLLERLDSMQVWAPGSDWILGQRVWYRIEGGDAAAALTVATECNDSHGWWCDALRGLALQTIGDYGASLTAFESALEGMDPTQADEWRVPRWSVDSKGRGLLDDLKEDRTARGELIDRLWTLADPLYLVPGNDRRTEHYARWTASGIRAGARNPFLLPWGRDLEQLTVRNGWEMGWERRPGRGFDPEDDAVGHQHPEGRDFMPPGEALERPTTMTSEDLRADRTSPRSLYAPAYAPVLLPMDGQIAMFPRGAETVVVATHFLPTDTTFHAEHDHPLPWMELGPHGGEEDRVGLFVLNLENGAVQGIEKLGRSEGTLLLQVPTTPMIISAESWAPSQRRAGRIRIGRPERRALEDLATLSDLLLLAPSRSEPERLEDAVPLALPRTELTTNQPFAIGWEVAGLGFRAETLRFRVSVERIDRSVINRIGGFLGLSDRPQPLELSWEEPAPDEPGYDFHHLSLDLPPLEPGRYEIRLVLTTTERSDAVSAVAFEVAAPR
jgi:hypothetical protein